MTATRVILMLPLCWALCATASAQSFAEKCKDYVEKKGYSADYIESKTGKRQPGPAARWKSNIELSDLKVGDVVFAYLRDAGGNAQRVAMVDEVIAGADGKATAVIISEWNFGKRFTDKDCFVTDKFGLPTSTREPVAAILRAWRPSLPLQ